MAKYFNVIDSFDTHARIPEHFEAVDKAAKEMRPYRTDLRRLGSRHVLLKPSVCKCYPSRRKTIIHSGARV